MGTLLLVPAVCATAAPPKLSRAEPEDAGMDSRRLAEIDGVVAEGIEAGKMPGCVVMIGRQGRIVFFKAYGDRLVEPRRAAMTTDTLFDLASLTKPVATATSVMLLVQQGKVRLDDQVARHVPQFAAAGKEKITVLQLLTHQGGLIPDNSLADYADGPAKAWERIFALKPSVPPGSKFIYSDMGFIVLGELVRRVSGKNVHEFSRENIFGPLGMADTGYLPEEPLRRRAAPTEKRDGKWMQGEVHDPRAHGLGGIAGHAGLFSTAADLAVYAQMMLGGGEYAGVRVLDQKTVERMTRPYQVPGGVRGLGWDKRSGYSSNRGKTFSPRAFGHGGFTGTSMWIDPGWDLFVVFLSSRLYPDGKGVINPIAGRIGTIAAGAIQGAGDSEKGDESNLPGHRPEVGRGPEGVSHKLDSSPSSSANSPVSSVLTGIDVLRRDGFRQLAGRRVGLITNQTGIGRDGASTVRLFHEAKDVQLVALFSPEHGLEGKLDTANIPDGLDKLTRRPVFSLYGKTRKPTAEALEGIDTLVFDIQDVGARFYTYISTMGMAMGAAAEHKIRFVVLDRPNPIGGVEVAGPVLDAGRESFVGFHTLPVRHGMTIGELARMFNEEMKIGADLQVVRVEGWRRSDLLDRTGLIWVNPSPNMRSLTEALLYPGIGLLETTNLSVGRGTDTPFEVFGAPWIDGTRLARELNAAGLPGVRFVPIRFTPESSVFKGEACGGVNVIVTEWRTFRPVRTGLVVACTLRRLYPKTWNAAKYDALLRNRAALEGVTSGKSAGEIEQGWQAGLEEFRRRRRAFLLY